MAWFLVAIGCLVRQLLRPGFPWVMGRVDGAVWLFLLVQSVSALVMLRAGQPRSTLNAMWLWIAYGLMFFCVRQLFVRAQRWSCSACGGQCVDRGRSGAVGVRLLSGELQQSAVAGRVRAGSGSGAQTGRNGCAAGSPQRAQFENRLASTEPIGSFALTNSLAGYLTPAASCCWLASSDPSARRSAARLASHGRHAGADVGRWSAACC